MSAQPLPSTTSAANTPFTAERDEREPRTLRECVELAVDRYLKDLEGHAPENLYQMVMTEVERPLLASVLSYTRGNQSQAAAALGINRNTLRKKLKAHGLD